MGHELGHYVLHHVYEALLFFGVLSLVVFALLKRVAEWALARWGERWRIRAVDDVAGLPLFALILTVLLLCLMPVTNGVTRMQGYEADIFGLNASRQPDGMALVALKLDRFRERAPGHLEEMIFFDHPSSRTRIHAAMTWKAQHLDDGG
jgi:STE24 endopeptidase